MTRGQVSQWHKPNLEHGLKDSTSMGRMFERLQILEWNLKAWAKPTLRNYATFDSSEI